MRWKSERYWLWYLVGDDGEILDYVSKSIGGPWRVKSTNKSYIDLTSAKRAAEKSHE